MPSRLDRAVANIARRSTPGRALRNRRIRFEPKKVTLGNGINNALYAGKGLVWAREQSGTDSNGNLTYLNPQKVRVDGSANIFWQAGRQVWAKRDYDGKWAVDRIVWTDANDSGNDSVALIPAHPANGELKLKFAKRMRAVPRNTSPPGTTIAVRGAIHYTNYGELKNKNAGEAAETPDLASFIPATGFERLAVLFWRSSDSSFQVFATVAQALGTGFTMPTDYQFCIDQSIHNDDVPGQAFILSDAQTSVQMVAGDLGEDIRQFINKPSAMGFPSTMNRNTRIFTGQNVTVDGNVVVTDGNLIVDGTLAVHSHPPNITKTNIRVLEKLTANVFELDTPVWKDIFIGLSGAKVPAANAPTWTTFITPMKEYTFAVNDYFDLSTAEMQHDYVQGTDFDIHVHWSPNGADGTDRTAKWQIHYSIANTDAAFPAATIISAEDTILAGAAQPANRYLDIGTVSGTGITIGAAVKLRITRIASSGTEPSGDPFGLEVGIHYQIADLGSTNETTK